MTLLSTKLFEIRELQRTLERTGVDNYTHAVCLLALGEFDESKDLDGLTESEGTRFLDTYGDDTRGYFIWDRTLALEDAHLAAVTDQNSVSLPTSVRDCEGDADSPAVAVNDGGASLKLIPDGWINTRGTVSDGCK